MQQCKKRGKIQNPPIFVISLENKLLVDSNQESRAKTYRLNNFVISYQISMNKTILETENLEMISVSFIGS